MYISSSLDDMERKICFLHSQSWQQCGGSINAESENVDNLQKVTVTYVLKILKTKAKSFCS